MAIYNENYLIEFFGIFNKKKKNKEKEKKKTTTPYKPKPFTDEEIKEVHDALKKIVQSYNADPKVKQEVLKLTGDWYDKRLDNTYCERNEFVKFYPFKYTLCDWSDNIEPVFEICDQDQEYRIAVSDIVFAIAEDLEQETGHVFGTGDGDEGCIYM